MVWGGKENHAGTSLLVLSISFIVSPYWVEQVYFLNQSAQVLLACAMIAVSILLAENARMDIRHRWYNILLAVLMIQAAFACYQILVMVYITGAATAFLIFSLKEERTPRQQFQWIGFHAGVFIAGFTVYFVIAQRFFMGGSWYLTGQIAWPRVGAIEGLRQCFRAIWDSLGNDKPYYTGFYGIFSILLIILTIYRRVQSGKIKKNNNILFFLAEAFLIISPYIFIFFYGGEIAARMQLVMPLSQGCILYLIVLLTHITAVDKTKIQRLFAQGIILLLTISLYKDTISHLNYCNHLYYTYDWTFRYDTEIADKLYLDIKEVKAACELDDSFDEVLFLGYPDIPYSTTCFKGQGPGTSFFQYDVPVPVPFRYRYRILYLMRNMGYPVECNFSDNQIAAYEAYFEEYFGERVDEMPCYPDEGYVQYLKDDEIGLEYLVIKLGDAWR